MTAFRITDCYYNRNNYSAFRITTMDFSRYIVNFYKNIKLKGYREPFSQMHVVLFACLGFYVLFSSVLNILSKLNPSSTNRFTFDQCQEENWNTRVISQLQDHQKYLFVQLTDLPDVTWLIHLKRSKKIQHVHGWKQAYPKLMHVLWYPK